MILDELDGLDQLDLEELAARHDTPFFLYDLAVIERRVEALRAALPESFRLAYAVKANPAGAILEQLAGLGLGADVASAGELGKALAAGFAPDRIVFSGPGKRDVELRAAVAAGIGLITVESPSELRRLEAIAAELGVRVTILLRWAVPPGSTEPDGIIDDGGAGKFGMDEADLRACGRLARNSTHLELRGIHAFGASNVRDAEQLVGHVRRTLAIRRALMTELGAALEIVDVGGGLGIPYSDDEAPLDLARLRSGLDELCAEAVLEPATRHSEVVVEPGRFLVGPAGILVTRVVDTKRVRGRAIAIVDGGINNLLRPVLVGQGQRIRRWRPVAAATSAPAEFDPGEPVTIAGPLCTGLDILARDAVIGMPEVGELLTILDAGGYGFTESMPLFLSRPIAAEVIVDSRRRQPARRSNSRMNEIRASTPASGNAL